MLKTTLWDSSEWIEGDEQIKASLQFAFTEGDALGIRLALNDIIKARAMTQLSKETGVKREHLYRVLNGDETMDGVTLDAITQALGYTQSADEAQFDQMLSA